MTFDRAAWLAAHRDELREKTRLYYSAHREEIRAVQKAWRARASVDLRAKKRRYYLANRPRILDRGHRYRSANAAKIRATRQLRRLTRPTYEAEVRRRFVERHPARVQEQKQASYARNAPKAIEKARQWRRTHPDARKAIEHRRRSRERSASGSFTAQEWREKRELFANLCAYCGAPGALEVEHRVPLSRGGSNEIANIVPACHRCNTRKGCRTDREFLACA